MTTGEAEVVPGDQEEIHGAVAEIRSAVLDGNTFYFFRLENTDTFYAVSAAENPQAVILNVGDSVAITYRTGDSGSILTGTGISRFPDLAGDDQFTLGEPEILPETDGETAAEELSGDQPAA